ncbi:hypothetical protein D9M70_470350 [compost metagenome]
MVSLPPARVTQPGSIQRTCSRFSSDGLRCASPSPTTGRTPAQVDSTSPRPIRAAGNCRLQAASRYSTSASLMRASWSSPSSWSRSVVPITVAPSQGKTNTGRPSAGCMKLMAWASGRRQPGSSRWLPRSGRIRSVPWTSRSRSAQAPVARATDLARKLKRWPLSTSSASRPVTLPCSRRKASTRMPFRASPPSARASPRTRSTRRASSVTASKNRVPPCRPTSVRPGTR